MIKLTEISKSVIGMALFVHNDEKLARPLYHLFVAFIALFLLITWCYLSAGVVRLRRPLGGPNDDASSSGYSLTVIDGE